MKAFLIAASLFFAMSANAALVSPAAETVTLNNQTVTAGGTVAINGQDVALTTVMAAMRSKVTAFVIWTEVYVVQFLTDKPEAFVKSANGNEALDSLAATQDVVAVKLDFKYPVEAKLLFNAFATALKANAVDLKSEEIKTFLGNVKAGGDVPVGSSLTLLLVKNADGTETVSYENNKGEVSTVTGAAGLNKNILSMWLGAIDKDDEGLKKTKAELVQ